jgi:hypothetical protein
MHPNTAWVEANTLFCDALLCGEDTAQVSFQPSFLSIAMFY